MTLHTLQNEYWQAGILPETGASVAFGRVMVKGAWRDILRPTTETDYGNSSKCASFIMMPWCNRIKDGILRAEGTEYQLHIEKDDHTARHGDVRKRTWEVVSAEDTRILMRFDSTHFDDINFPFRFTGEAEYRIDGGVFTWRLSLRNDDTRSMPCGFGHHPYFVRDPLSVTIPCATMFVLENYLAVDAPIPIAPEVDFRIPKPLGTFEFNHVLSGRVAEQEARIVYEDVDIKMTSDPLFSHYLIYAPAGEPFWALEPMTQVNDGFNLYERGISEAGVLMLAPGEMASAEMHLTV